MVATINASVSSSGIVSTADGSGILKVQSNGVTTNALAWVNFNGTGGAAIRSSYNVSSVTRSATGRYLINFTNSLADANYTSVIGVGDAVTTSVQGQSDTVTRSASVCGVNGLNSSGASFIDVSLFSVAIFGN